MSHKKIAVFFDRDGTIIVDKKYLKDPMQVELLEKSKEAVDLLRKHLCLLFLFSNQSGIPRGMMTMEEVLECNARMVELLGVYDKIFEDVCIATELPADSSLGEIDNSIYRKPSPRFILEMIRKHSLIPENCYMVGDKESDVFAGLNAQINSILISQDNKIAENLSADSKFTKVKVFKSIFELANWLISEN